MTVWGDVTKYRWVRKKFLPPEERDKHIRRTCEDYGEAMLKLLPVGQAWPREEGSTLVRVVRALACYWGWVDGRAADLLERESDPRFTIELLPDWERAWGLPDPCWPDATTIDERRRMLLLKMTWMGAQSRAYFQRVMKWLGFEIDITEFAPFMAGISRCGETRGKARTVYEWRPDTTDESIPRPPLPWPHVSYDRDNYNMVPRPIPSGWMPKPWMDLAEGERDDNFRWYVGPPEMRFAWSAHTGKMGLVWFRAGSGQAGVDHHLLFRPPQDTQCLLNRWMPAHTALVLDFSYLALGDNSMEGTFDPVNPDAIRWPPTAPHERLAA